MACVHVQHMHKSLDQMNLQIHHVISDITGVTGLAIVDAIVAGKTEPQRTQPSCATTGSKPPPETVTKSLVGDYRPEHIFTLKQSLTAYRYYQQLIADCDHEVQQRVQAFDTKNTPRHDGATATPDSSPTSLPISRRPRLIYRTHLERIFGVDLTRVSPVFECLRIQTIFSELGADLSNVPNR